MFSNWITKKDIRNLKLQQAFWLAVLLAALSCLSPQAAYAYDTPAGYDSNDYQKLVTFLELPNGAGKNGNIISATYNPEDPTTWSGVTWNTGTPKRVTQISWYSKGLVGSLDLSGCTALYALDCSSNKLTSLDVSGCTALYDLDCYSNQLTSLDVSACTVLKYLYCDSNQLTSLDVSSCTALKYLCCYSNQLTFADLPVSLPVPGGYYNYSPQGAIPIGTGGEIAAGVAIDLSAEANIDGVNTTFTWFNGAGEITPTTASGGCFTFDQSFAGQTIYCGMANTKFPGLTLETSQVLVVVEAHQITFIKPTAANDATNPVNISSGSLVIATINGDMDTVTSVTIRVDDGAEQAVTPSGNAIYYLLPTNLTSGEHTITIKLIYNAGQEILAVVTFHWDSYRRGFGFGRFDFGAADTH